MTSMNVTDGYYETAIPVAYPVSCAIDKVRVYRATEDNYDPAKIAGLIRRSRHEGFNMISRMDEQWRSGENRFSKPGEGLYFAEHRGQVIGMLARVADPHDEDTLELRMGYVMPDYRHFGIGGKVLQAVCDDIPQGLFRRLVVRAHYHVARSFCLKAGFQPGTRRKLH